MNDLKLEYSYEVLGGDAVEIRAEICGEPEQVGFAIGRMIQKVHRSIPAELRPEFRRIMQAVTAGGSATWKGCDPGGSE